jgi:hypothetical protein
VVVVAGLVEVDPTGSVRWPVPVIVVFFNIAIVYFPFIIFDITGSSEGSQFPNHRRHHMKQES